MLDFNTKRELLKNLRAKRSKNKLMWLPCVIAELAVKLWFSVACSVDMALSDKEGNFLGLKKRSVKKKARKRDDIVYVKKPFLGRVISALLAVSFAFMMVPELGMMSFVAFADDDGDGLWRYDEINQGQCIDDTNTYYFDKKQYSAASNATAQGLKIVFANGCAQLTWSAPDGFASNENIKYFVGYNTETESDVMVRDNYGGTSVIVENLGYDMTYTFYVIPQISLNTFVVATIEDAEGNKQTIYDDNGKPYYSQTKGTKRVEGQISYFNAGSPNGKIFPDVTLTDINFDSGSGEVVLQWKHSSHDSDGNLPYGYVIYRSVVGSSATGDDYEIVGTITAESPNLLADGITMEYRDSSNIKYGTVYQYYVMAYRNLFGGTNNFLGEDEPGTITSGVGKKLLVSIPPSKIPLNIESNYKNTLTVSWKKPSNSNVSGYLLYRSETNYNEKYIQNNFGDKYWDDENKVYNYYDFIEDMVEANNAKPLSPTDTSYDDIYSVNNKLNNSTTYYYYLIPYSNADKSGIKRLYGPMTSISGAINATLGIPQFKTISSEDGNVSLQWESIKNADGYRIYYTKLKNADGTDVTNQTTEFIDVGNVTKYTHTGLLNGEQYSYAIKAFINVASDNNEDNQKLFGGSSQPRPITVGKELDIPQNISLDSSDGTIAVSWEDVDDAEGYILYYQKKGDNIWTQVRLKDNKFEHTGLKNNDEYSYYVKAYKTISQSYDPSGKEQVVYSEKSRTVSAIVGITLDTPKDFCRCTCGWRCEFELV